MLFQHFGAFYYGLARIWNFPYAEEVVGTITVIDTLLGALLGISTLNYEAKKEAELQEAKAINGQDK